MNASAMVESIDPEAGRRPIKAAGAFRTISEVAQELEVPQHVLRFWESKFSQIKPLKRGGGRRYYRPEDVALLRRIRQCLYDEGYTIKGVQRLLREGALKAGAAAPAAADAPADLPAALDSALLLGSASPGAANPGSSNPGSANDELDLGIPPIPARAVKAEAPRQSPAPDYRRVVEETLRELTELRDLLRPQRRR
jgi:DNA-binding transcriptional MerR regulator